MDANLLLKLKDALSKSDTYGIAVGGNPSLDQMAAALSLYLTLSKVNKKTIIASPTDPIVEVSTLVGIDRVKKSLGTDSGELIVSFPYVEGEIEKVSYTLEDNHLNIVVKPGEKGFSFEEKDVKYTRGGNLVDLLFVIGASKISDLGDLMSNDKLNNTKIINIDNNLNNQGFGDIAIISPQSSSISEQVAEILTELGFNLDQDTAQNLLSGIMSATNNFTNPNSSPLAFKMAGVLMQKGATRGREPSVASFMSKTQMQTQEPQIQTTQTIIEEKPVEKVENPISSDKAPLDWLTPKVYKGGSGISTP